VTDRAQIANRDIYDVYFFFKNWFPINEAVIIERTGKNVQEYLIFLLKFLKSNLNKASILQGLWEVLDAKQKNFVKSYLLAELEGIIRFKIGS
jgi:protoheme ferro-lyase